MTQIFCGGPPEAEDRLIAEFIEERSSFLSEEHLDFAKDDIVQLR
jgi:hypothetical protein